MSDYKGAALMIDAFPKAKALLGDRGYHADWLRAALADRGIAACIPSKVNRKVPIPHDTVLLPVYREVAVTQSPQLVVARSRFSGLIQYVMIALPLVKRFGETECVLAASFYEGDFKRGTELDGVVTQEPLV